MFNRKMTKLPSTYKSRLKLGKKWILCKECDITSVEVGQDISAVTCAYCVQRSVEPPVIVKKTEPGEKFPRGWALKARYVHTDGRVFERGKDTGEVEKERKVNAVVKKLLPKKKTSKKKRTARKT